VECWHNATNEPVSEPTQTNANKTNARENNVISLVQRDARENGTTPVPDHAFTSVVQFSTSNRHHRNQRNQR
jgi:hypothetical protein